MHWNVGLYTCTFHSANSNTRLAYRFNVIYQIRFSSGFTPRHICVAVRNMGFALATMGSSHIMLLKLHGEPINIILHFDGCICSICSLGQLQI